MAFLDNKGLSRLWQHIIAKLGTKADISHTHDDIYYTEVEIDEKLIGKSDVSHNHDSVYETKADATTKLDQAKSYADTVIANKADINHIQEVPYGGTGLTSVTKGSFLVGNDANDMVEMTPDQVLSHINGATIVPMTTAEYETMTDDESNANALYILTDSEEEEGSNIDDTILITVEDIDAICGASIQYANLNEVTF